jgi:hypothetical protein
MMVIDPSARATALHHENTLAYTGANRIHRNKWLPSGFFARMVQGLDYLDLAPQQTLVFSGSDQGTDNFGNQHDLFASCWNQRF